ncbi:MAG: hypothetical protein A2458_01465 [Candidatus Kerfeldbacteria bacterium RIFOXYC2_FULL_38_9]|nr:MAG: hypothetical protein A2458_01465 [Candidatus Kerfeldbacteria bacterium RIFOXYC2_FULL_38_9]
MAQTTTLQAQGAVAVMFPWNGDTLTAPLTGGIGVLVKPFVESKLLVRGFVAGGVVTGPSTPLLQIGALVGMPLVPGRLVLMGGGVLNVLFPNGTDPVLLPTAVLAPTIPLNKRVLFVVPITANKKGASIGAQIIINLYRFGGGG